MSQQLALFPQTKAVVPTAPKPVPPKPLVIEVVTQDFDDLNLTDEFHDIERKERLWLQSFNTKTKRVVFRGRGNGLVVGTAVTPKGNPIKSSDSDGIYRDREAGASFMYVAVNYDGRR